MSRKEQQRQWFVQGKKMTEKQIREGNYTSEQRFFMLQGARS